MISHVDELERQPTVIEIDTSPDSRLVVSRWDTAQGRSLVSLAPEYRNRRGEWRLAHSAVSFAPADAQEVAAAVLEVAAEIDRAPANLTPTETDCDNALE